MRTHFPLTEGPVSSHIWRIALPASTGIIFNTLFNVVDTYFAGQLAIEALAALTITFPVYFIIISLSVGLMRASSSLIAFHLGKKAHDHAEKVGSQTLLASLLLGGVIWLSGTLLAPGLFALLGAKGTTLIYSHDYIQVIFWGSGIFAFSAACSALLLARGVTHPQRNALIGEFVLNCFLDPWFMYGGLGVPAMGLMGIGLATVVAKSCGTIYIYSLVIREEMVSRNWRDYLPKLPICLPLIGRSLIASMDMLTIALGFITVNYFIRQFGDAAVAGYGIGLRIEQIALLPTIGLNMANLAIVGQNYGAGAFSRIRSSFKITLFVNIAVITLGAMAILGFAEPLTAFFTDDPETIMYGSGYLMVAALISWSYPISGICITTLQGMQRFVFSFVIGLIRQFIVRIPLFALVMMYTDWGIKGIWWTLFAINWMATVATVSYTLLTVYREERRHGEEG